MNALKGVIKKEKMKKYLLGPEEARVSKPYGLVKLHKEGHPVRMIIPMIGTVTQVVSKLCAKALDSAVRRIPKRLDCATNFIEDLTAVEDGHHMYMVSLDVKALFPNVDVAAFLESLPGILAEWRATVPEFSDVLNDKLLPIFKAVLQSCYFEFDGNRYHQIYGTPMGNPCSVACAELAVAKKVEEEVLDVCPPHLSKILQEIYR